MHNSPTILTSQSYDRSGLLFPAVRRIPDARFSLFKCGPPYSLYYFFPQNYAKNFMNFADRIYNNSRSQFMSLAMQFAIVFDAPICFDIEPFFFFLYSTFTQLCLSQPLSLFTQSVNTKIRREQTK